MALHDLTPQLRTRLSRMERAVGWFVFLATLLLFCGFGYYIYSVAESKGWFIVHARFHTYIQTSAGIKEGDPVKMMGFDVGHIIKVHPMPPGNKYYVRVDFEVRDPYFRYIWTEGSFVKINSAGFLNQRELEVTRATNGYAICVTQPITVFTNAPDLEQLAATTTNEWQLSQEMLDENSNVVFRAYTMIDTTNIQKIIEMSHGEPIYAYDNKVNRNKIVASWHRHTHRYENFRPNDETAWLPVIESPAVSDRLQAVVEQVERALPNFLAMTNQLTRVLNNGAEVTSNLNITISQTHPLLNNVNTFIENSDTNLTALLIHLSDITSNLAAQVQSNTNMLGNVSKTIVDYDTFVQGLKHHWLLRSAFKKENKKNDPPAKK